MSVVTNVIVAYGICANEDDHQLLNEINAALPSVGQLKHVDSVQEGQWYGGSKALEVNIAIGAFNGLDLVEWVMRLTKIDYSPYRCDFVQLFAKEEDDAAFRLYAIWDEVSEP